MKRRCEGKLPFVSLYIVSINFLFIFSLFYLKEYSLQTYGTNDLFFHYKLAIAFPFALWGWVCVSCWIIND